MKKFIYIYIYIFVFLTWYLIILNFRNGIFQFSKKFGMVPIVFTFPENFEPYGKYRHMDFFL